MNKDRIDFVINVVKTGEQYKVEGVVYLVIEDSIRHSINISSPLLATRKNAEAYKKDVKKTLQKILTKVRKETEGSGSFIHEFNK